MATAVVLGGGVSGLAAAYYLPLRMLRKLSKVIVLEKSGRVGGWVESKVFSDGTVFEHGPRSLRPVGDQGRNTLTLAEDLELTSDVLPVLRSSPAAKNRFLYVKGNLHALPSGLRGLFTMEPFNEPILFTLMRELWEEKSKLQDETVHDFVERRLGEEMAELAISALCRGVYAGDSRKLSIRSCFPDLYQWEQDHGSIIRGALKGKKNGGEQTAKSDLVRRARSERWASWSLRGGLQQLTDRLQAAIESSGNGEVRLGSPCLGLEPTPDGKVKVKTEGEDIMADYVFSAIYAKHLAGLLPESMDKLSQALSSIPAVDVYVVNLEYDGELLPVEGFGHLLPAKESGPKLGVVYDSCPFPQHNRHGAPLGCTRLTVMLGGAWFQQLVKELGEVTDANVQTYAITMVRDQLGIQQDPVRAEVTFQKDCIPQYHMGHHQTLANIDAYLNTSSMPLFLLGSSYRGASVNDCILNARRTVESLRN